MKIIALLLSLSIFLSCATSKTTSVLKMKTPLADSEQVEVLGTAQAVSSNAELIGHVKIGDSGMTIKCSYDIVIKDAITQAKGMGGNILRITKHKEPNMLFTTCHRIWADVYYLKK